MPILEDRGLFWWADNPVPSDQFAPSDCIPGALTIDEDGTARLELDGYLPGDQGFLTPIFRHSQPITRSIQGLLKSLNKPVQLHLLTGGGARSTSNGMSFEKFIARRCVVAEDQFGKRAFGPFTEVTVPLNGLEEWMRCDGLEISSTDDTVSIAYKSPRSLVYEAGSETLRVSFFRTLDTGTVFSSKVHLNITTTITIRADNSGEVGNFVDLYRHAEEFLMILTGYGYSLDWPTVQNEEGLSHRVYFTRLKGKEATPPSAHECVTSFPDVKDQFGHLWGAWRLKREQFGPGFYLYLGMLRSATMYAENGFINLVVGLEAFHRKKFIAPKNDKLTQKIERILAQVSSQKDKRWLKAALMKTEEPNLEQRLLVVLKSIPIEFQDEGLRTFAHSCARLRNDLSHFGGQRQHEKPYSEFVMTIAMMTRALDLLFKSLLLAEIGVDSGKIRTWIGSGFRSPYIKAVFSDVGLMVKSTES